MRNQIKSAATATLYAGIGLFTMLNPLWWLRPVRNPYSPEAFSMKGRVALLYRLDLLWQTLTDRPLGWARRRWIEALQRQVEALPEGEARPLPEFEWRERPDEECHAIWADEVRPVVLRSLLPEHADLSGWTFDQVLARYGTERVRLSCPANIDYEGALEEVQVPGVYLQNIESLFARHPEILERTGVVSLASKLKGCLKYAGVTHLFVGRKKTGSRWHCAPAHNMFLMMHGRKKWTFIDPAYTPMLAPLISGLAYLSGVTEGSELYEANLERLGEEDRERVLEHSRSELARRIDHIFTKVPRYEVILEPGDVLLNAPWWWHEVSNLGDESVGVATRWFDFRYREPSNPTLETLLMINPLTAYKTSMAAFEERLMTLEGELARRGPEAGPEPGPEEYVTDLTRVRHFDGAGEVAEGVEAYYARHGYSRGPLEPRGGAEVMSSIREAA